MPGGRLRDGLQSDEIARATSGGSELGHMSTATKLVLWTVVLSVAASLFLVVNLAAI